MALYEKIFRKIWDGWKKTADKIAVFQTKLILTILYVAVIGPIAILIRLFFVDLLGKKKPKKKESCWHDITFHNNSLESCQRQF